MNFAGILHRNLLAPALLLLSGAKPPEAPQPAPGDLSAPLDTLRPIGTTYTKYLPGSPLDPRSLGHAATYQVVNHLVNEGTGERREVVRRVHVERVAR